MKKLVICLAIILSSCKDKESAPPALGAVLLEISYHVDGQPLLTDVASYTHPAGYTYNVSTLQYFISGLVLHSSSAALAIPGIHYVDRARGTTQMLLFNNVNPGSYNAISFHLGLDSTLNISGLLDTSADAQKMEWPQSMGGGYHFLKMEGYYIDSAGKHGYAMHLGRNENLVSIKNIPCTITVKSKQITVLKLKMNINEWYRNPSLFDFNSDGNYIMTMPASMMKLSANASDIFQVEE